MYVLKADSSVSDNKLVCFFPGEDYFSHSQHSLVTHRLWVFCLFVCLFVFLSRVEALWTFGMDDHVWIIMLVRLSECSLDITRSHSSQLSLPDPLALTIFLNLSCAIVLSLRCSTVLQMYPLGLSSAALHFSWLQFSVTTFICCRRSFLGDR